MNIIKRNQDETTMKLVQITEKNSRIPGRRVAFELLLAIALSVGCWYTFFSMFPNPVDVTSSAVMITLLPVGLYLLCWNPFLGRFLFLFVFLLAAFFFVAAHEAVEQGFLVMANNIIEALNAQMGAGLVPFEIPGDTVDWGRDAFVAMISVMLVTSMAIVHGLYHKEPLVGFVLTGLPVAIGLWLKATPSIWLLSLLLLSWTGMLVLSVVARPDAGKKNRPIYVQNEKNSVLPYLFLGITLVVLLAYVLLFSGDDYRPPQSVDEAKAAVVEMQEHLRYDKLGGEKTDALSEGDLTKTHPLAYTGNTVLELKLTTQAQISKPWYLRGFSGGDFQNGKWVSPVNEAYSDQYLGIVEELAKEGFYPWAQQQNLWQMTGNGTSLSADVKNVNGSSKYLYLPYESMLTGDAAPDRVDYERDYGAFSKGFWGQREYSFDAFVPSFADYDEAGLAAWLEQAKKSPDWAAYAQEETAYRNYVYHAYLHVSDEDADALGTTGIDRCVGKDIGTTLSYIRQNFNEEFVYNEETDAAPDGKDELHYFLNESRSGNDMHFATAAALMFRQAGIPARYAEGYYLPSEEMEEHTAAEVADGTLDVLDSHAHSWVEVYVDEIGWFPVEVVPGFYDETGQNLGKSGESETADDDGETDRQPQASDANLPQDSQGEGNNAISPWWVVLAAILLAIALCEYLGRQRMKKRLAAFGTECTEQQVYAMYGYLGKIMAFDKHPLRADPYEQLEELTAIYDKEGGLSFEQLLQMVYRVRFGGSNLTPEEHREMARYVQEAAQQVYQRQKPVQKFIMKFVLFYV